MVDRFVTINPISVRFDGFENDSEKLHKAVEVIPTRKYPFEITSARASKGENIKVGWKKKKEGNRIGYIIEIENIKKTVGRYFDTVVISTDNKIRPELYISVMGKIQPKHLKDKKIK